MKLIIGNKNYSSWSLRAWLVLHAFGVTFEEQKLMLFSDEFVKTLASYGKNKKVPLLINGEELIWDSLSIAEYINDHYLQDQGWGKHKVIARSLACEMHSGFFGVRNEMPMNIRAKRKIKPSRACLNDIERINQIFSQYRKQYKHEGDYLLGQFSIVDCFYAPVVFRFATYAEHSGIALSDDAKAYCQNMLKHPSMQAWKTEALAEPTDGEGYMAAEEVGKPL